MLAYLHVHMHAKGFSVKIGRKKVTVSYQPFYEHSVAVLFILFFRKGADHF